MSRSLIHALALFLLSVAIVALIFENSKLRKTIDKYESQVAGLRIIALSPYNQVGREYWVKFGAPPYNLRAFYTECIDGTVNIAEVFDSNLECSRCASESNINNYKVEWEHNNKQED